MINIIKILSGDTTHWSVTSAFFPDSLLILYCPTIWLKRNRKNRIKTIISKTEYAQTCTPPNASWVKISTKIIPENTILSMALLMKERASLSYSLFGFPVHPSNHQSLNFHPVEFCFADVWRIIPLCPAFFSPSNLLISVLCPLTSDFRLLIF